MSSTGTAARLDEARLASLYEEVERPLYNVVYRWLWSPEDTMEVVQEAFMRLWKMRDRADVETLKPLVFRIATNLAKNRCRQRRLWRLLPFGGAGDGDVEVEVDAEVDRQPGADVTLHARRMERRLRDAVEALPERLREVVMLCELSGMSYEEIGAALGIPPGTVGSRRHKALALLRARLGDADTDTTKEKKEEEQHA